MKQLLTLLVITLLMTIGLRTQPPRGWRQMSQQSKILFADGVNAGIVAAGCGIVRVDMVTELDRFYRVRSNDPVPLDGAVASIVRAQPRSPQTRE